MTKKDKIAYGKLYSKFNARIERYALAFFIKVLKEQSTSIRELIDKYPIEVMPLYLNELIKESVFQNAFNKFYQEIGEKFLKFHSLDLSVKKDKDPLQGATNAINISFRNAEKIAELAKISQSAEVGQKVSKITEHTRKLIRETIEQGIASNKTKPQIAKEIQSKTGGAIAKKRALVIARTETTFISSKAAEINIQDSPFKMLKTWIPVSDMRTRPDHIAMFSHKPIPKDEMFNVGGVSMKYPGDFAGGAANVCNCRCAILYTPVKPDNPLIDNSTGSLLSNLVIGQILSELFSDN
jgi:Phage Mu protein F like protein